MYKNILRYPDYHRRTQRECGSLKDEIALYKETVTAKDQIVVDLTNQVTGTNLKLKKNLDTCCFCLSLSYLLSNQAVKFLESK